MLEHPWTELQLLIKEKWLTQKAFSSILWKKVSEVNELLKWKRNITIQRDYLLHQTLWTPIKYWILKQIDYDYSLLDIEDFSPPVRGTAEQCEDKGLSEPHGHSERNEDSINTNTSFWTEWRIHENIKPTDSSADKSDSEWQAKSQEIPIKKPDSKDDEDLKNRAKIFRTF
jgi:hypothetical protein